jgi:Na+/phosphate symporter
MEENNHKVSLKNIPQASRQAILEMAQVWRKKTNTIHHAIKAYEEVIIAEPTSEESARAKEELFQIAKEWEKQGKIYAANSLYAKLMFEQI